MPCFKGLAVSIHTSDGPLTEYSVQKATRLSRITTYIPVPPPRIPTDIDTEPQPSTFAISITLLTPGQDVPYSVPKPSLENPHPGPRVVGALPGHEGIRGKYTSAIGPYVPLTTSPNETIAAYIYFDGRAKEEVATLLRKGEETWVNSRWVGIPESEGGGLAEREFLFREVGLERWLNGLDLEGKDAAAIIERRRQKLEKRRRRRKETPGSDDDEAGNGMIDRRKETLRYGADGELQDVSDDEGSFSDSDSSDDDPIPEATGQIKVALFRVLASGEIKRGEYSPQFDAHDDSDNEQGQNGNAGGGKSGGGGGKDVDHTTSFAKPKSLDPKTISTQTVTGIDPSDKPYAVFTFLYRGERQLQKMGILPTPKQEKTPTANKRRSGVVDLPSLGPLKKEGTVGFLNYRERDARSAQKKKAAKAKDVDAMDSDSEDDDNSVAAKMDDVDEGEVKKGSGLLSPEDAERAGQVSEGIRKMKLKRQHSAEPLNQNGSKEPRTTTKPSSPSAGAGAGAGAGATSAPVEDQPGVSPGTSHVDEAKVETKVEDDFAVGSPFKRHRSSIADFDDATPRLAGDSAFNASGSIGEVMKNGPVAGSPPSEKPSNLNFGGALFKPTENDDEL